LKKETIKVLAKYGVKLRKKWGQHILINKKILQKIVNSISLDGEEGILEIGPGIGVLTKMLAKGGKKVIAVEIDPAFVKVLKEELQGYENVRVIHEDILRFDIESLPWKKIKVVGNLPYYIGTKIITHLLTLRERFTAFVFMLQKEVVERILAKPGQRIFGSLTLFINYHTEPELITYVPRESFLPPPKVDGAVVRLNVLPAPRVKVKDEKILFRIIKEGFSRKRKLLINAISRGFFIEKERLRPFFLRAGVSPSKRAEEVSLEEFARLSDLFFEEGIPPKEEEI
jgi:16S rRNA (adenine1518-N6/adenine1519-N6)-dimethyltransferase